MPFITSVLHNGVCNRLLPLISTIRLARKTKRKTNVIWTYTPVRSCIAYHGELCKLDNLFVIPEDIIIDNNEIKHEREYEFKYWENKDHVIDVKGTDNIFTNYALYTIISTEDDQTSILKKLKSI